MPGFSANNTFKIFIGKIPEKTTVQDIQPLFENYGKVVECDVVKNYGFVHMEDPSAGQEAIKNLNGSIVNGTAITVEEAKSRKRPSASTTKIFVGNIGQDVKPEDIEALFSKFGTIIECDLVRNYGFVHIDTNDLTGLLKELNGYEIGGQQLKVQISTSRIRQRPGMGNPQQCYKCGVSGHWSKECTQSSNFGSGHMPFLQDAMHGVPAREFYSQAPPSVAYVRDRMMNGYSAPDMRDYYEQYCQNTMDRYDDYAAMSSRRNVYAAATRVPSAAEYDTFSRRSSNSNIAHYHSYGYGDSSTAGAGPTSNANPYPMDGRLYDGYNAAMARSAYSDERHSERRDGASRSSRYAPY